MGDGASVAAFGHQACFSQFLQVMRNGGLAEPGQRCQFVDAECLTAARGDLGQQHQPRWISQHLEQIRVVVRFLGHQGTGAK